MDSSKFAIVYLLIGGVAAAARAYDREHRQIVQLLSIALGWPFMLPVILIQAKPTPSRTNRAPEVQALVTSLERIWSAFGERFAERAPVERLLAALDDRAGRLALVTKQVNDAPAAVRARLEEHVIVLREKQRTQIAILERFVGELVVLGVSETSRDEPDASGAQVAAIVRELELIAALSEAPGETDCRASGGTQWPRPDTSPPA